ncbi:MAG: GNAT family N-acetyltransferase [Novosphingobium sp.]
MKAGSVVRAEWPGEEQAVAAVIDAAFAAALHAGGNEAEIVAALRASGDLTLALVATDAVRIIGQAAFSPVAISDGASGWFGLGPVAVLPDAQGKGIGDKLIRAGLAQLAAGGAAGCVVLGDPTYYGRFGFRSMPQLTYPGVPPEYFQALAFSGAMPGGIVRYAAAFG